MSEYKYKAFITYSHKDENWAAKLHKSLETYSIPKRLVGQETEYGPIPKRLNAIVKSCRAPPISAGRSTLPWSNLPVS